MMIGYITKSSMANGDSEFSQTTYISINETVRMVLLVNFDVNNLHSMRCLLTHHFTKYTHRALSIYA